MITNGCQQALDLIGRVLLRPGDTVAVEDPLYTGLKNLLTGMGAQLCGIPVGADGMDPVQLERVLEREKPRFLVVTSNFQNPTGVSLPLAARKALLDAARKASVPVIENDAYGELRYSGEPLPALKQLDEGGGTVLLRSFSKVSFPGLRVGWAVGPKPLIDRLRHAKEAADLHTDQLSQAVLLEFAESGRLEAHRTRMRQAGSERLAATLEACAKYPARGHALDASGRRHECLGPAAGTAGCGRAAGAGAARRRGIHAGAIFRGFPAGAGSAAIEFCRADAGADPEGAGDFGTNDWGRAGEYGAELRAFARDGLKVTRKRGAIMFQFSSEQFRLKVGLAEMLKGGVIMDVTNAEQAKIAEDAGASAVMALERVPSDIRKEGGVARMANIEIMEAIMNTVHIPVMAKARIGHFMEARVLEVLGVDFIDESEVLTPADEEHHIDKNDFKVPFVCGARNLGEALRRIGEGAAMIRTKGEAGSGNIVEAVRHIRTIVREMKALTVLGKEELATAAKNLQAPLELVEWVAQHGTLPVPNFSAGGIATPADAALVMQLGAEAVFVGSGIFKSSDPANRADAIVMAAKNYNNPEKLLEASRSLGAAMPGLEISKIPEGELLQTRGW